MKWLLLAIVALAVYIRSAPSDPDRWHHPIEAEGNRRGDGFVIRLAPVDLTAVDAVARGWPRTVVLAGSVDEGRITYVTRSKLWGFPDYTTVETRDEGVAVFARLRFGRRDFGVNAQRVRDWLTALGQGEA